MDAKQAESRTSEENAMSKLIPYESMQPDALAEIANDAAEQAEKHGRKSVQSAIVAGEALAAARQQIPHGEWLVWLKVNWNYTQQWGSRLMQVANYAHGRNLEDFASVKQVLREIGEESAERETKATGPSEHSEPIEVTASEPQSPPEPRQPSVSVKKPREPREAPAERLADSEPFALGERLDSDRADILAMSGDYLIAKKLNHFVAMLRKVASDLEGTP